MSDREILFKGWPSCSDGYCVVRGKATGMKTNGGCKCLVNATRRQLTMLQGRLMFILDRDASKEPHNE